MFDRTEWVKKVSEKNRGKKRTDEQKEKISKALTGRRLSEEHKEKLRKLTLTPERKLHLSYHGYRQYGPRPDEVRKKISESHKGKIGNKHSKKSKKKTAYENAGVMTTKNSSGFVGVSWHNVVKKWRARINVDKKEIRLGYFDTPQEAAAAYANAIDLYYKKNPRTEILTVDEKRKKNAEKHALKIQEKRETLIRIINESQKAAELV